MCYNNSIAQEIHIQVDVADTKMNKTAENL
jgi:hypothetical protein